VDGPEFWGRARPEIESARERVLRTTFSSINAARDGFVVYDAQRQQQIVADAKTLEEGKAAFVVYRQSREHVLVLFEGVYHALATALLANDAKSLSVILDAAVQLQKTLDDLKKAAKP